MINLKIRIDNNSKTKIIFNPIKKLIGNDYQPIYINNIDNINSNMISIKKIFNKMLVIISKTIKIFTK